MEHSLSSELIKRLSHWQGDDEALTKNTLSENENAIEEDDSEVTNEDVTNGSGEDGENPALEGHFLTERPVVEVTILDNCECSCHRDAQLTFELNMPFSCSKCNQQFCCKCQFLVHRDFHRGERKYPCLVCGKSYYYKSDLVRHQPVHSTVKPHMCKVCGRTFNQVGHLITHRLVHTGEKPFACDVCSKPFNRKSNLQKHKMIHTGERPFLCLVCGSRFSRKGDLQRHTMLHTGERPFKCEQCDKSFSQKPHLLSHQSVHTGERPYKCLACSKSFNRKSNLLKHQITKCPALSLRKNDRSELDLTTSTFFSHFNHLISSKGESDEPEYFSGGDTVDVKPVITLAESSDNPLSAGNNVDLPSKTSSMLRARLSSPGLPVLSNVLDVTIKTPRMSKLESALLRNNNEPSSTSMEAAAIGNDDSLKVQETQVKSENLHSHDSQELDNKT